MHVVVDTDFLSALYKINHLELIYEALDTDKIYITQAVFNELAKAQFFYDFVRNMERIELVVADKLPESIQSGYQGVRYSLILASLQGNEHTESSCTVKIPIIGHAKYINYFMQVLQV